MWQTHLSWDAQRAHYQWDVTGRLGPGRLVLHNVDLRGASLEGGYLHRVALSGCNLTHANLAGSGLEDARLEGCQLDGARLNMGDWDRAVVVGCSLLGANLDLTHLDGAWVEGGVWREASMVRVTLDHARLSNVDLSGARLMDARVAGCVMEGCILAGVDFSRSQPLPKGSGRAVAHGARFVRCDLRGANVDGLMLGGASFVDCQLDDLLGTPLLDGPVHLEPLDAPAVALARAWRLTPR